MRRVRVVVVGVALLILIGALFLFLRFPTASEIVRASHGLLPIGDSKSSPANPWIKLLATDLNLPVVGSGRYGINSATVAEMASIVKKNLPRETFDVPLVLLALGSNDVSALPSEADWKASYRAIIDDLQAKWPGVVIYVARPYRSGYDVKCDLLARWLDDIAAAYPGSVRPGMDERQWLKPNIDTLSFDGTHYTVAGQRAAAAAWLDLLTR